MFGPDDLTTLVERAGKALECEERYLAESAVARGWQVRDRPRGIRFNINERYYQFIIWRALMSSFRCRPETERKRHDLSFFNDVTDKPVAAAEIKGWWKKKRGGEAEIAGIRRDKEKLGTLEIPGVMLIFTSHFSHDREDNLSWLVKKLEVERSQFSTYAFDVVPWPGMPGKTEFMLIGFLATAIAASVGAN